MLFLRYYRCLKKRVKFIFLDEGFCDRPVFIEMRQKEEEGGRRVIFYLLLWPRLRKFSAKESTGTISFSFLIQMDRQLVIKNYFLCLLPALGKRVHPDLFPGRGPNYSSAGVGERGRVGG